MSLLGIDVGTTGCKAVVFSESGEILASRYVEYDISRPLPTYMELDARAVWNGIRDTIRSVAVQVSQGPAPQGAGASGRATAAAARDPIRALSVSSMGEAFVPVSAERQILGNSILLSDSRGAEEVDQLRRAISDEECYRISGNPIGMQYGLPKLMWIRRHDAELYGRAFKFLNWGSFVTFMLGAPPVVDYCLANRDLLFDIAKADWSSRLLDAAAIDREKLPDCVPPGTLIGRVDGDIASELGLPPGTAIVSGAHDQCANALGCGVVSPGSAMFGMGTFPTIVPVFDARPERAMMLRFGLNTEHHALPDRYVSFIYHMGGSTVKWFRDTFAAAELQAAARQGADLYSKLFAELPDAPGPLLVLPHFAPMGPPDYESDSAGVILGLSNHTKRGEILKGIVEGNAFALKVSVDNLASIGVELQSFTAVGGGSRSDEALQLYADLFGRPFERPDVTEAGALGCAVLAAVATKIYPTAEDAVRRMVHLERRFEPDPARSSRYAELFEMHRRFQRAVASFTKEWVKFRTDQGV